MLRFFMPSLKVCVQLKRLKYHASLFDAKPKCMCAHVKMQYNV